MTNSHWKDHALEYLKENYQALDINELSASLNRTKYAIRSKAKELKLTAPMSFFSNREDNILIENYGKITIREMSEKTGKSYASVCKRLFLLRQRGMIAPVSQLPDYNIESGIPIPKGTVSRSLRQVLKKMNPGDSFLMEDIHYQTLVNQFPSFPEKKFATKKENHHRRIWRII